MADSERRAKGRAMRRKLMGDAYADKLDSRHRRRVAFKI